MAKPSKAVQVWKTIGWIILVGSLFYSVLGYQIDLLELPLASEYFIKPIWGSAGMKMEVVYCMIWVICLAISAIGIPVTLIVMAYNRIKK